MHQLKKFRIDRVTLVTLRLLETAFGTTMRINTPKKKTIRIKQADWGQALALRTHLGTLFETVFTDGENGLIVRQPLQIDPGQILLASASLRALIFDDTGEPLLISFLKRHAIELTINSFEGDFAMLFYAQTEPEEVGHLAQFLVSFILGTKEQDDFPEGEDKEFLIATQGTPDSLQSRFDIWAPTDRDAQHSAVGRANDKHMLQLCHITRKHIPIEAWGGLRMGFLKDIPIRRKSIIEYVANRLGGVHFDSQHHTKDVTRQNEFRLLSQAYDWEHQAILHGAIVATAISAIELASCPTLLELYFDLRKTEKKRRDRLLAGEPLPQETQENTPL